LKPPITYRLPPAVAAAVSSTGAGSCGSCLCGGCGLGEGDGEPTDGSEGDELGVARTAAWFDPQAAANIRYARPASRLVRFIPSHNPSMATALSLTHLGSLMRGVRSVDEVGADERAAALAKRSIKKSSKLWALDLAVRCMDLTTLEGADTPGKVAAMCAKAIRPKAGDATIPSVAAVCVYPLRIADCVAHLRGSTVRIASVATAFPSGQSFTPIKVAETEQAVRAGAHEIDMVIDRGAFLSGDYQRVYDEIVAVKEACGPAHLKVILETGELGTYDAVRRASILAMAAGADFIKTSTGKVQPAATLPVALVMMESIRDFVRETGRPVGFKAAGGIRTAKQAIAYLVLTYETLGPDWMTPELLRLGASTLLNDVLMQIDKERTGAYQSGDYFTID
jgi:deoxyribose-phosphate aldolase